MRWLHILQKYDFRFYGIISFIAICYTIIFWTYPNSGDDFGFMLYIRDYLQGSSDVFPWDGIKSYWDIHYNHDCARLSNFVLMLMFLIPRGIYAILSGLAIGLSLFYSAKLANIGKNDTMPLLLLSSMFIFLLPWHESIFLMAYTLNYVWATTLMVLTIYFFIFKKNTSLIIMLALGLITGIWHEGFSVPLVCGFICWSLLNYRNINPQRISIIVGLLIGIIWLFTAPGMSRRSNIAMHWFLIPNLIGFIFNYLPFVIIMLISILSAVSRRYRHFLNTDTYIILFIASVASFGIMLCTGCLGYRVGWACIMCSIILLSALVKQIYPNIKSSFLKNACSLALLMIIVAHLTIACHNSFIVKHEYEYIVTEYHKSADGTVFAPVTFEEETSVLSFKKPEMAPYYLNKSVFDSYHSNNSKELTIIPIELKNYQTKLGTQINGNSDFKLYNNRLVTDKSHNSPSGTITSKIDFGLLTTDVELECFEFSSSDGSQYIYAKPRLFCLPLWLGLQIKAINIPSAQRN